MKFSVDGRQLTVKCPAKINTFLRIAGRRPDGYHQLQTVMIAVDLCDLLHVAPADQLSLSIDTQPNVGSAWGPAVSIERLLVPQANNLVLQAAEATCRRLGETPRLAFHLRKSIPMQSGLGGGSSNAAAAIVASMLLTTGKYDPLIAADVAAELGSDINFFLDGYAAGMWVAECLGRGEIVRPLAPPPALESAVWVLLLIDGGCETRRVFQELGAPAVPESYQPEALELNDFLGSVNDLSRPAAKVNPRVAAAMDLLSELGNSRYFLSGSGSTVCVATDWETAETLASWLSDRLQCPAVPTRVWRSPPLPQGL